MLISLYTTATVASVRALRCTHNTATHVRSVPIDATEGITVLYVFVDIKFDLEHFLQTVRFNFPAGKKLVRAAYYSADHLIRTEAFRRLYQRFSLQAPFILQSRHSQLIIPSLCRKPNPFRLVKCVASTLPRQC